jgi:hypothetical protein
MKFAGYFPDRGRLHPLGQGTGHPGRPGPWLGRRLAGRLGADHHRPRSAALRPAVRALPQSRSRLDAGLRHRLLPGPPRRGDPLRQEKLRRDRVAQIITFGTCRRAPCCATSAACCRCPMARSTALQAGAEKSGQPGDAREAIEGEPRCQEDAREERVVARLLDIAQSSRACTATPRPMPPAS